MNVSEREIAQVDPTNSTTPQQFDTLEPEVRQVDRTYSPSNEQMVQILDFLKMGDETIQLSPNEQVALLLGITGSGKSSLAQLIAGDPDSLFSTEVEEGTGDFVIVDAGGKISSNSTVLSRTVFPDLVADRSKGTILYDCPGFSDTRSAAHEIGATYFIRNILASAKAVKLVFVVSHHSVRKGVDRKDFILLLRHAIDFIKDVGKYKDSIALVVTKVENTFVMADDGAVLVPDEKVVKSIASFIGGVRKDIAENPELLPSGHSLADDFLDALLHKEDEDYTRIGIFRRPNKAGLLSESKLMQTAKQNLNKIINENIVYKEVDLNDFGFTVSSDSKIFINDLLDEIQKNIMKELIGLGKEIEEFYSEQENGMVEIEQLEKNFRELHLVFSQMQTNAVNDLITLHEYFDEIKRILLDYRIVVSDEYLKKIEKDENYIEFLNSVKGLSPGQKNVGPSSLANGFEPVSKYLTGSWKWYSFMIDLYSKLSQYDIQKKKNYYATYLPVRENSKTETIKFLENIDIEPPLQELIEEAFKGYDPIELNAAKLNSFKQTLELTLNHEVEAICNPDGLLVKGQFVVLSEVINKCDGEIKFMKFYALEKVFIDIDLDLTGKEAQVAIAAPEWEFVGNHKITLDGRPGPEHYSDAASGVLGRCRGLDGAPGLPGGPAGSFFGIGERFVSDNTLRISAKGGRGGRGQNGGDGADGRDADPKWDGPMTKLIPLLLYNQANYFIRGLPGGDGGHGGAGGYGGPKGEIRLVLTGDSSFGTRLLATGDGERGASGHGGSGGRGGRHGEYVWYNLAIVITDHSIKYSGQRATSGRRGFSGLNEEGIQYSWQVRKKSDLESIKTEYLQYSNENLKIQLKESHLRSFYQKMAEKFSKDELRKKRSLRISEHYKDSKGNSISSRASELNRTVEEKAFTNPSINFEAVQVNEFSEDNASRGSEKQSEYRKYSRHLLSDDESFITSGAASLGKYSPLNTIINVVFGGFMSFKPWLLIGGGNKISPVEEAWNRVLPFPPEPSEVAPPLQSAHAGVEEMCPSVGSQGNLLLWDLLVKMLSRRDTPRTCYKMGSSQEADDMASRMAYSYYAPKNL